MLINKVQNNNYTPHFQGILRINNLKNGGEITELKTTLELDKGLAESALKNLFEGRWVNDKRQESSKLIKYVSAINQTLGINLPKISNKQIELRSFDKGYSIKANGEYEITHIREDFVVWQ